MAFFHNRTVNLFNMHFAIFSMAFSGGGAFYVVYLVQSGLSVPVALLALGSVQLIRFFFRPVILVVAVRFGLKTTLLTGTVLTAAQYPFLAEVGGLGAALYGLVLITALSDAFYWVSYHATFARLGDDEHRGAQIGVQQAAIALAGIFSPVLTAWLLLRFGPRIAFDWSAVIVLVSALPLLWIPNLRVAAHVRGGFRAALNGVGLQQAGDGWVAAGVVFVWQIALFRSLGNSVLDYGGALAIAALVGAAGGMMLGRWIDAGHGIRMVWIGVGVFSAMIVLRALAFGHPAFAVAANALGPLASCLYAPICMAPVYTRAKSSPCALRFHMATEGAWDIGNVSGCVASAALVAAGLPLSAAILLSLGGTAIAFVTLRRYYGGQSAAAGAALEA